MPLRELGSGAGSLVPEADLAHAKDFSALCPMLLIPWEPQTEQALSVLARSGPVGAEWNARG